jgi:membrane-bound lytic murein transglycosylase
MCGRTGGNGFVEADLPLTSPSGQSPFGRLMIAQDTGSAIVGPARADLFFGAGEEAGRIAGRIQQSGRLATFVPRELGSCNAKVESKDEMRARGVLNGKSPDCADAFI